jgi:hypothetical protein
MGAVVVVRMALQAPLLVRGLILTVVEDLFLLVLVPYDWPLIGRPWNPLPESQVDPRPTALASLTRRGRCL